MFGDCIRISLVYEFWSKEIFYQNRGLAAVLVLVWGVYRYSIRLLQGNKRNVSIMCQEGNDVPLFKGCLPISAYKGLGFVNFVQSATFPCAGAFAHSTRRPHDKGRLLPSPTPILRHPGTYAHKPTLMDEMPGPRRGFILPETLG